MIGEERVGKKPSPSHDSLKFVLDKMKQHKQTPTKDTTVTVAYIDKLNLREYDMI